MISQKALDELGEDGFIQMLRFVDWLFYSHEAYDLTKWGIEGVHYDVVDGQKVLKVNINNSISNEIGVFPNIIHVGKQFWGISIKTYVLADK